MIKRKRLLIPITIQFSVRYILRSRLMEELQKFCEPVLLLNWKDEELEAELNKRGIEYHYFPQSVFGRYFRYLTRINVLKYSRKIKSVSTAIDNNRRKLLSANIKKPAKKKVIEFVLNFLSRVLPDKALKNIENSYIKKSSNLNVNLRQLAQLRIDAVLTLTPFIGDEFLILKSFGELKIPLIYSVLSFDNLTTRGYLPVKFDHFFVWNTLNKNEVLRIFGHHTKVDIVGPVQFDFYWDDKYIWKKEKWKEELKITTDRPIILFGAGHYSIVPNEPDWLLDIDRAISNGEVINNPLILYRRHPVDPADRWLNALSACKNVVIDNPWKLNEAQLSKTNITDYDIAKLCSTLHWTDVHVNASSTLTLDGAIFNKPQIGPAYCEENKQLSIVLKELYYREHYLPITTSGGLQIAYSKTALINYLNEALTDPGKYAAGRKAMVDVFCEGKHGESALRLATNLHAMLS